MDRKLIRITDRDNVAVAISSIMKGEIVTVSGDTFTAFSDIPQGHKIALCDIKKGEKVIKYGYPIGAAKEDITKGQHVHAFNISTLLSESAAYTYDKATAEEFMREAEADKLRWKGHVPAVNVYVRKDGRVGIHNSLWIVPTVGCVNGIAEAIRDRFRQEMHKFPAIEAVKAFTHNYGCSQLGDDHRNTRQILADMVRHPNAAGVLVIALGCENNQLSSFMELVGQTDGNRVKFMEAQKITGDEVGYGLGLLRQIAAAASADHREDIPVSELRIGLKCGGSDGFSGITANPLLGRFSDWTVARGGTAVLTEVPEMFGAETLLMARCNDRDTFGKTVRLINGFKEYFMKNGQPVYENPSPGNKAGGISTLEEKSLGCTQKSGKSEIKDVLDYGERLHKNGLNLLCAPGNDLVASTALAASGCQIVLFTTGRGTPFGTFVPTVKISSNTGLAERKPEWIDFNAGVIVDGQSTAQTDDEFIDLVLSVASGKPTCNERAGYSEIAIFKTGVTL